MSSERTQVRPLSDISVRDCMHHGVLTCAGSDPLRDVAAIMAAHRVHAVVITDNREGRALGVVSDLDVATAIATDGLDCTALAAAATEPLTVPAGDSLRHAAQLMSEHGVSHLIVVEAAGGYPLGVLSTLDLAAVYAET